MGMTCDIKKRVHEHKNHLTTGSINKYIAARQLYLEEMSDPDSAINREKQIKA
jgi:putative endonuclease